MRACQILRRITSSAKPCPVPRPLSASASPRRSAQIVFQYPRLPRSLPRTRLDYSTRPSSQEPQEPQAPQAQPREASSLWSITFTLLALGGGAWLHNKYFPPRTPSRRPRRRRFRYFRKDQARFLKS
ncbi:CRAL-TRIO domain-containing protein [Penicillium macrosclerotiorum]|uniref:CRAL-TRIO domain-containing protein n=1 Tax=Penicillium macrosclerotiorum TaxID=303699 RepID=UPI0025482AC4|nr:CRAL-TRIO domain-containing protein [Penicillium macrosclerotiorum]KAJ5679769.1 CRAL-TRIO domain-containing protein [Penicillium macrosclerotiorum]